MNTVNNFLKINSRYLAQQKKKKSTGCQIFTLKGNWSD